LGNNSPTVGLKGEERDVFETYTLASLYAEQGSVLKLKIENRYALVTVKKATIPKSSMSANVFTTAMDTAP
jgi:hypothetical protein